MRTNVPMLACVAALSCAQGCASVDVPKASFSRVDDAHALRLKHLRLWTNSGYPLWLEVQVPRAGEAQRAVTLIFTTNISSLPRFAHCQSATLSNGRDDYRSDDVRYARTPIEVEADLGPGSAGKHYHEHGVVEDIYVVIPETTFADLLGQREVAGDICREPIRFESWHVEQMRRLLRDRDPPGSRPLAQLR